MRKSSAVVVLFVLITSGAFGEMAVSGVAGAGSTLLKGSNMRIDGKNDPLKVGNYLKTAIEMADQNDEGTIGGNARLEVEVTETAFAFTPRATVWWQPIPNIRLLLGSIDEFGLTDIVGWGYHANDAEEYVVMTKSYYAGEIFANNTGFYSGTGSEWVGTALSVSPFYGLTLTLAVPYGRIRTFEIIGQENETGTDGARLNVNGGFAQNTAAEIYEKTQAQIAYEIWGVGKAVVSFAGGGNGKLEEKADLTIEAGDLTNERNGLRYEGVFYRANAHTIFASFFLTALEDIGMYINVGVGYTLPVKATGLTGTATAPLSSPVDLTYQMPIAAGLGFSYGTDLVGVKAQLAATFGGKATATSSEGASFDVPTKLGFGVLPYFTAGIFKINLNLGVSYRFSEYEADGGEAKERPNSTALGWFVNPYVTVNLGIGMVYVGLQVGSSGITYRDIHRDLDRSEGTLVYVNGEGGKVIQFGIPIGIQLTF